MPANPIKEPEVYTYPKHRGMQQILAQLEDKSLLVALPVLPATQNLAKELTTLRNIIDDWYCRWLVFCTLLELRMAIWLAAQLVSVTGDTDCTDDIELRSWFGDLKLVSAAWRQNHLSTWTHGNIMHKSNCLFVCLQPMHM